MYVSIVHKNLYAVCACESSDFNDLLSILYSVYSYRVFPATDCQVTPIPSLQPRFRVVKVNYIITGKTWILVYADKKYGLHDHDHLKPLAGT